MRIRTLAVIEMKDGVIWEITTFTNDDEGFREAKGLIKKKKKDCMKENERKPDTCTHCSITDDNG